MAKMRKVLVRRPHVFLLVSTLLVLFVGSLTVLWQVEQGQSSKADGANVVGSPSLPATTVNTILTRAGSPMAGTGAVIEQAARQSNIDDAFALAVWWTETNDGATGVGRADHNPGGVRASPAYPSASDGYTVYPSYSAGIFDWFNIVKGRYISRGLTTVYAISHPYVGTSSSGSWANKVVNLMLRYRGEAPLPTPSPTAKPKPVPHSHVQVQPESAFATSQQSQSQAIGKVQTATNSQFPSLIARISQAMMVMLGLMMALLLFLWGKRTRPAIGLPFLSDRLSAARRESGIGGLDSKTGVPLPAWVSRTTANLVSPSLQSAPSLSGGAAYRFEPMRSYTSFQSNDFSLTAPLPRVPVQPSQQQPGRTVPVAPVGAPIPRAGLSLPSYGAEARLRRVTLLGRNGTKAGTSMITETNEQHIAKTAPEWEPQTPPEPFVLVGASGARKSSLWGYGKS